MAINPQFNVPGDGFDSSEALATRNMCQGRVYPFGSDGPLNLTSVDVAFDPAIKAVAPFVSAPQLYLTEPDASTGPCSTKP